MRTRAAFFANRSSCASAGCPSTSQSFANWPSLPTASAISPSRQANTSCGWMFGCALPVRRGAFPETRKFIAWLASIATCTSSMPMSMYSPAPDTSRRASAASTATAAYMPVIRSTIGMPTFCGPPPGLSSRSPVTLIIPPIAWIMKSYAAWSRRGPVWPKPVTEQ